MFSDFDKNKKESTEERGRMGVSLAVSSVVYVVAGLGVAAAVATASVVVDRQDRDVEIQFAAAWAIQQITGEPFGAPQPSRRDYGQFFLEPYPLQP